jgi:hypothetical protein
VERGALVVLGRLTSVRIDACSGATSERAFVSRRALIRTGSARSARFAQNR